jgi:hypothetical protein
MKTTRLFSLGLIAAALGAAQSPERIPWQTNTVSRGPAQWQFQLGHVPANHALVLSRMAVQLPRGYTSADCSLTAGETSLRFRLPEAGKFPMQMIKGPATVALGCVTERAAIGNGRVEVIGHRVALRH